MSIWLWRGTEGLPFHSQHTVGVIRPSVWLKELWSLIHPGRRWHLAASDLLKKPCIICRMRCRWKELAWACRQDKHRFVSFISVLCCNHSGQDTRNRLNVVSKTKCAWTQDPALSFLPGSFGGTSRACDNAGTCATVSNMTAFVLTHVFASSFTSALLLATSFAIYRIEAASFHSGLVTWC